MTTVRTRTDDALARIAARDADVRAWAFLDPDLARAQADALDRGDGKGALHGVPVGVKDVLTTADMPTQYNCALYDGHFPRADSACVALLRQAGAVILGKTETVELASIGRPAPTRNPHALTHTPGGSSSGSAAAVADGHVPLAIGTQTGGSIIRPASFCGVWALKPSWGSVSTAGAKPFAPSLDTIGWFGRGVDDVTIAFDALVPTAAAAIPPAGRIGIWRTAGWGQAEAATRDAMDSAIALLRGNGFETVELELPLDDIADVQQAIMRGEGRTSFLAEVRRDPGKLHPRIVDMVSNGPTGLWTYYDRAAEARCIFEDAARGYDAILAPSTPGEAPEGLENTGSLIFNGLFTLLHVPCVNLPLWRGLLGLPVGLTLTGARGADHTVLAIAKIIASFARESHSS